MDEPIDKILSRWRRESQEKSQWHSHWEDLARVMLPRRMGFVSSSREGERMTDDIYDGTPMQAARGLANAIGGMMRPSGIPDMGIEVDDEEAGNMGDAQEWLEDSKLRLRNAFANPRARFMQVAPEVDQDLVVFGTAVEFIGDSKKRNSLLFQSLHLKDSTPYFDEEGSPQGLYHERTMTLRQMVEKFGEQSLSESTRRLIKDSPEKQIKLLHAVIPRKEFKPNALFARDMPIADIWIEIETKHQLSVGGFHEFPFIVPRWDTSSGETFGRSPAMIALPDADTLQAMGETILIAGQRAADPPLMAPNDGSFDSVNTFPGGLGYYDIETAKEMGGNPFFTLPSGTDLPITRDMQSDTRNQIMGAFFRNVFNLPVEGPQMTAAEVMQRKEEFIREIGPLFGRYETEKTGPEVERAFMLMLRAGSFGPIPQSLQGKNVVFTYESPVKRIRKQIEAAAARLWAESMLVLAQSKPEAADLVDVDALGRFSADALGIPKGIVVSPDIVNARREQRAQEMQAQQQAAMMAATVDVVKTGAEAAEKVGKARQTGMPQQTGAQQ